MGALVSVARSIRLISRLVGMAACAFSLSGCYFANGIDVVPQAFVRRNSDLSAGEVEFYRCGQRIINVKGAVRVSSSTLALDLEYPWPERSRGAERLEVVAFLNDTVAPSSPCLTPK